MPKGHSFRIIFVSVISAKEKPERKHRKSTVAS